MKASLFYKRPNKEVNIVKTHTRVRRSAGINKVEPRN